MVSCRKVYAEVITDVKRERGLKYKDIMELSGLSKRQVWLAIKGETGIAIEKVEQLLDDLEVVIIIEEVIELRDWCASSD